jgi:hypothetical protein
MSEEEAVKLVHDTGWTSEKAEALIAAIATTEFHQMH